MPTTVTEKVTAAASAVTTESKELIVRMISVFLDKSVISLVVPPAALLGYLDMAKLLTLLEWMLYAAVIAGFAIQISRVVFPQINLAPLVEKANDTAQGAAIVAASVVGFVGLLMLALALWTKP